MDEVSKLHAHIAWCRNNLAIIERRPIHDCAWQSEHDGWHAYIATDARRLCGIWGIDHLALLGPQSPEDAALPRAYMVHDRTCEGSAGRLRCHPGSAG